MKGRRLVLIDIENVVGGGIQTSTQAHWARTEVERMVGATSNDQVIVGTSHFGLFQSHDAWPSARLVVRSGENGADLALLDVMMKEELEERFQELVLVSGDGIFSEEVARLGALGVHVTVLGHKDGMSKRLSMAASKTLHLSAVSALIGEVA